MGFQQDTPAAVIFQVTKQVKKENSDEHFNFIEHQDEIFDKSCCLLLLMTSPDALIRLQCTNLKNEQKKLFDIYFNKQKHESLSDFVFQQLQLDQGDGILLQVNFQFNLVF